LFFEIDNFFELSEEPAVDFGELKNLFAGEARAKCMPNKEDAFGIRHAEPLSNQVARQNVPVTINALAEAPGLAIPAQAISADFATSIRTGVILVFWLPATRFATVLGPPVGIP
jgi:hypothetical protein